jgi:lipid-A-disaccharide synthase-like uncharacterized protein
MFVMQLSKDIGGYLYDVFIDKADMWLLIGIRRAVAVHRAVSGAVDRLGAGGRSVMPLAFWFFSIGGG